MNLHVMLAYQHRKIESWVGVKVFAGPSVRICLNTWLGPAAAAHCTLDENPIKMSHFQSSLEIGKLLTDTFWNYLKGENYEKMLIWKFLQNSIPGSEVRLFSKK